MPVFNSNHNIESNKIPFLLNFRFSLWVFVRVQRSMMHFRCEWLVCGFGWLRTRSDSIFIYESTMNYDERCKATMSDALRAKAKSIRPKMRMKQQTPTSWSRRQARKAFERLFHGSNTRMCSLITLIDSSGIRLLEWNAFESHFHDHRPFPSTPPFKREKFVIHISTNTKKKAPRALQIETKSINSIECLHDKLQTTHIIHLTKNHTGIVIWFEQYANDRHTQQIPSTSSKIVPISIQYIRSYLFLLCGL